MCLFTEANKVWSNKIWAQWLTNDVYGNTIKLKNNEQKYYKKIEDGYINRHLLQMSSKCKNSGGKILYGAVYI